MTDDPRIEAAELMEQLARAAKGDRWHVCEHARTLTRNVEAEGHLFVAEVEYDDQADADHIFAADPRFMLCVAAGLRASVQRHEPFDGAWGRLFCSSCRTPDENPAQWPCPDAAAQITIATAYLRGGAE